MEMWPSREEVAMWIALLGVLGIGGGGGFRGELVVVD